jgi:hypothetical protein
MNRARNEAEDMRVKVKPALDLSVTDLCRLYTAPTLAVYIVFSLQLMFRYKCTVGK